MKRAALTNQLELVGRALADSTLVPIFNCFVFEQETVYAYSDTLGILSPTKCKGTFAVNGKTLLGLLQNSHAEDIEFLDTDKDTIIVKTGKSTFKMPAMGKEDFLFEEPQGKWALTISIDQPFIDGLEICLSTSSRDHTAPALMGVTLKHKKAQADLYACDGDAITRHRAAKVPLINGVTSYTMPNAFCEALVKIFKDTKAESGVLRINDDWAEVAVHSDTPYSVFGRIIKNPEPFDHEAVIKDTLKEEPVFVPVPASLDAALSRARVVADPESQKTVLTVDNARLTLFTSTHMGEVKDTINTKGHPDVEANVSAALMQRSISTFKEMAILENCTVYRQDDVLFQIVSNMDAE